MLTLSVRLALLCLVLGSFLGEGSKLNVNGRQLTHKRLSNHQVVSVPALTTTENVDYCEHSIKPPVPDFSAPGQRLSQVKCREYIWNIKILDDERKRQKECSLQNQTASGTPRVVGGRNAFVGEFPHMGAVGWEAVLGRWVFKCGCSVISPKFVMTAAHCTKASPRDSDISDTVPKIVRLGAKNILDTPHRRVEPIDANIIEIIVHPRYNSPANYFDIALMELDRDVQFSDLVHPACLWGRMDTTSLGTKAVLTGWGVVDLVRQTSSPVLKAAVVDIIDTPLCNRLLMPWFNRNFHGLRDQICGGNLFGGVDACQGDSGGPLQVKINLPATTSGSIHYIIGVISSGIGCGRPHIPGIYTRVSSYIDWIETIVWKE